MQDRAHGVSGAGEIPAGRRGGGCRSAGDPLLVFQGQQTGG